MIKKDKTSSKRPKVPFKGAVDGVPFSKDNQPAPELKSKGWEQWRRERHLTQSIIKIMLGKDGKPTESFKDYVQALVKNAQAGNATAIGAVNKCLEDEIIKVAQTDKDGNDVKPFIGMIIK